MYDTQAERIVYIFESLGMTKAAFARYIGKNNPIVHEWTKGTPMSSESLALVSEKTGVPMDWIARGTGPVPTPVRQEERVEIGQAAGLAAFLTSPLGRTASRDEIEALVTQVARDGRPDYEGKLAAMRAASNGKGETRPTTSVAMPANITPRKRRS